MRNGAKAAKATLGAILVAVGGPVAEAAEKPRILDVRTGDHNGTTQLLIETDRQVPYRVTTRDDNSTLVVDLPRLEKIGRPIAHAGENAGKVKNVKHVSFAPQRSRIVADLNKPVGVQRIFRLPPDNRGEHRLIVAVSNDALAESKKVATSKQPLPGTKRQVKSEVEPPQIASIKPVNTGGPDPSTSRQFADSNEDVRSTTRVVETAESQGRAESSTVAPVTTIDTARFEQRGDHVRFVMEVGQRLPYRVHVGDDGEDVVIKMPRLSWRVDPTVAAGTDIGWIRGVQHVTLEERRSHVMLDTRNYVRVRDVYHLPAEGGTPTRLVVEMTPVDRVAQAGPRAGNPIGPTNPKTPGELPVVAERPEEPPKPKVKPPEPEPSEEMTEPEPEPEPEEEPSGFLADVDVPCKAIGVGQVGTFSTPGGTSDAADAAVVGECEARYTPTAQDTFLVRGTAGFGRGLNNDAPTSVNNFASKLEGITTQRGGRNFVANAWYRRTFFLDQGRLFAVSGGLMDASRLLDRNRFANDNKAQFMNEVFVNTATANLPSSDPGLGAKFLFNDDWTASAVWMAPRSGFLSGEGRLEDQNFHYFGGQVAWRPSDLIGGEGNYRLMAYTTSNSFPAAGSSGDDEALTGVSMSADQDLTDILGAFARIGYQDDDARVRHNVHVSGGLNVDGSLWGRRDDQAGAGVAFLNGASGSGIDTTQVVESYIRFQLTPWAHASLDAQYIRDGLTTGGSADATIGGLRLSLGYAPIGRR